MSSSLRSKITKLTSEFTQNVVDVVKSSSLNELAEGLGGDGATAAAPAAPHQVSAGRPGKANGKANGKSNGSSGASAAGKRDRRTKVQMEKLRMDILAALRESKTPMKAGDIAAKVGEDDTHALSFPMRQLVQAKLISQSGERAQARYTIRVAGKEALSDSSKS